MTDNEIIKALEYCFTNDFGKTNCNKCAFYTATAKCVDDMQNAVIDFINRQKEEIKSLIAGQETLQKHITNLCAEIERLEKELMKCKLEKEMLYQTVEEIKFEATKEFAEKFAKALSEFDMSSVGLPDYDRGYKDCMTAIEDTIDSLVKMTEVQK